MESLGAAFVLLSRRACHCSLLLLWLGRCVAHEAIGVRHCSGKGERGKRKVLCRAKDCSVSWLAGRLLEVHGGSCRLLTY